MQLRALPSYQFLLLLIFVLFIVFRVFLLILLFLDPQQGRSYEFILVFASVGLYSAANFSQNLFIRFFLKSMEINRKLIEHQQKSRNREKLHRQIFLKKCLVL